MWVFVKWWDTTSIEEPWSSEEESLSLRPLAVITVGKLLCRTDEYITVAGSVGCEDGEYGDVTCIPTGCLIQVIEFKEPDDGEA